MTWLSWQAIKLFLGGWLKRLWEALGALFAWARRNPSQAAIIALCVALAVIWRHDAKVIATKDRIISAQGRQIDAMKRASEANRQAQLAQKALYEARYRTIAHDADTKHAQDMAVANDRLRRYIDAHRLRDQGNPGGLNPSSATEGGGAQGVERSGFPAGMVAVSAEDLQICSTNTERLVAAHDWAMKLVEANGR